MINGMSITEAEIKKLASLSRIKLADDELAQFKKEIDSILGYIEQIKEVSASADTAATSSAGSISQPRAIKPTHRNVLREDIADRNLNQDASEVLTCAPSVQDGMVKVKKILN